MKTAIGWTVTKIVLELNRRRAPWESFDELVRRVNDAADAFTQKNPQFWYVSEYELTRRQMRRIYYGIRAEISERISREWLASR